MKNLAIKYHNYQIIYIIISKVFKFSALLSIIKSKHIFLILLSIAPTKQIFLLLICIYKLSSMTTVILLSLTSPFALILVYFT